MKFCCSEMICKCQAGLASYSPWHGGTLSEFDKLFIGDRHGSLATGDLHTISQIALAIHIYVTNSSRFQVLGTDKEI